MPRPLTVLAAAGVAVFACVELSGPASSARSSAAPTCTLLAAKSGILASDLPMHVKRDAAGHEGAGIDRLICRDLTHDARRDMVASIYSSPMGIEAWVFFRAATKGWRLSFRRTGLVRAHIRVSTSAVIETEPIYKAGDKRPCCPTGGQRHLRFKWRHGKMLKVAAWHTGG
jgi:hypothetical protein